MISTILQYSFSAVGALVIVAIADFNRRITEINGRIHHMEKLIISIQSIDERLDHIEKILDKVVTISVR